MATRVALNGFGRIGRNVLQAAEHDADVDIVAVNDRADPDDLRYLLQYDSVYGQRDDVALDGDTLRVGGQELPVLQEDDPAQLPWDQHDVDIVFECTGVFRDRDSAGQHLDAGADTVLLSAPPNGGDVQQLVYGVNHEEYTGGRVVSNASCTTNCAAPMAKAMHEAFGIQSGVLTTVHAYTGSQALIDGPAAKRRRGRAAAENIVPTSTGAADAVTQVIPALDGKLDGMAMRVPTPNGSVVDLVMHLEQDVDTEQVNQAFRNAARNGLDGVLSVSDEELVSRDILGNPHSCIIDAPSTMTVGNQVKVLGWYDNEYGFSCRMLDTAKHVMQG